MPTGVTNDNAVQFGSQVITISSVAYVARNIRINRPTREITRMNEYGVPDGQVFITQVENGTASLQYPDASADPPVLGTTFTLSPPGGGAAVTYIIKEVGDSWSIEDQIMCDISFNKRLASS